MSQPVDQAEGLRRLLTAGRPRIVALLGMSAGVGATTAAMNLAVELARDGGPVLLLDEHAGAAASACASWAVAPPRLDPRGAPAEVAAGVQVLAAPAGAARPDFNPRALCPGGLIVIDVALDAAGQLSPLARLADDLVVVMQPLAASITATYAGLKRMQYIHALQTFQFLVANAASEQQAEVVIANVVNTSSRFLAVSLKPLGWIPADALVGDAGRRHQTVCEAHPGSAAACAFRRVARALRHGAEGTRQGRDIASRALARGRAAA
ncbi:flagellar biosynthesis protein FlhG [Ramlibacter sp.]|uniref:flagellar biosynthesis protein FlhG n=1 Tax=Ramlibacter sp. TaxID=1917967 RepID=UPI002BF6997E|nr:flagellar biosynthesis protein FlhG [Ramlibacter sp.]HWI83351.1 flagellar biosynthesis protein FlhG [Ramlibacter sp.]